MDQAHKERSLALRLGTILALFALISLVPPHVAIQRLESPYYRMDSALAVPLVGGTSLALQVLAVAACLCGRVALAKTCAVAILCAEVLLLAVMSGYGNGFWLYAMALLGALQGALDIGFWCLVLPPIMALFVAVSILRLPAVRPQPARV